MPYKAFDRVFDNLTRHLNTMPADAVRAIIPDGIAALTHLFPVLLHVPVIADVVYSDTLIVEINEARQVAFSAAKQLFQKLDDKYNVIIHIDDVHWGDEDSVSLLRELLSRPDAPSILVVGSFHTEAIGDSPFVRFLRLLLSRESDKFFGQEIELGPLDQVQALSLARYLLRDVPVSDRHLNQIVQESYGNPFFLESLTRHLTDFRAQGTETQRPQTGTMTPRYVGQHESRGHRRERETSIADRRRSGRTTQAFPRRRDRRARSREWTLHSAAHRISSAALEDDRWSHIHRTLP